MPEAEDADRGRLVATAFRLLGTTADAEDAVQEAYTRWFRMDLAEREQVRNVDAWFTTVVGRICLDVLGSARARREQYTGEWLPEPRPGSDLPGSRSAEDPAERVSLDDQVTSALMVVLDSLTPAERVSFVLHDLFGLSFVEVADVVGRSPQAARKLASDARRDIRERKVRDTSPVDHARVVEAFLAACGSGRLDDLVAVLDPSVTLVTDGGGRASMARRPVQGSDRVARFLLGIMDKIVREGRVVEPSIELVDGRAAIVLREHGVAPFIIMLNVVGEAVQDVWIQANPDKLGAWAE
ncbi:RNA polymerase sigma factor SigJ [Aeromicrobium sp. Leaf350]|uniref:RNA polymerase sigma factor SigJ n=1 Tax=Aeromicrobium sp. Leaf350 TaxID=2876565 RepID=UPI001E3F4036|nr:RNA polymerase sigma factor SigJ [Aeromicrobium sp. Leaf350]